MNEQNAKLYEQALEFAYENVSKEIWNTDNFHAIVAGRFAELIVRECAKIADIADENKCEWIGGNVLRHFGVAE